MFKIIMLNFITVFVSGCELLQTGESTGRYETQVIQKVGDKCPSGYSNGRGAYCYSIQFM